MPSSARRWWILVVIGIAQLMVILDNTIVNIALPSAQHDLGFSDPQRQWIVTAYALSFGSLLLLGGRLSDVFGRRAVFVAGLIGFALASIVGGLTPNVEILIASRALQGVFGALLAPAALSLLTTTFPAGRERARAFGVFSAVAGSGAATGLLLGGALTQYLDWRWCMYVNAVFAAVALTGALILLPHHQPGRRPHLDLVGTVLAAVGLFCVVFGLGSAETGGWSSPEVYVFLGAGLVVLIAFVVSQRRIRSPLLPLRVLLDRFRGGSFLTIFTLTFGMFSVGLFLTFVLQQELGFSPLMSGVAFLPMVLSIVSVSTTAPSTLLPLVGPKPLVVIGMLLGSGALFWLSRMQEGLTYAGGILGPLIMMGVGMGLAMSTAINTATLGVDPGDAGVASAGVNTMQQVGGSVGTAALSSVAGTAAAAFASGGGAPGASALHGYAIAFTVSSAVFLVGAVVVGLIVPLGRPHRASAAEPVHEEVPARAPAAAAFGESGPDRDTLSGAGRGVPELVGQVLGDGHAGAVLTLIDPAGRQIDRVAADDEGRYRLSAPSPGSYTVVGGSPGFLPVAERIWLPSLRAREHSLWMEPAAQPAGA